MATGRSSVRVFVGLGSNLDGPLFQVEAALTELARADGIALVSRSRPYLASPWGLSEQPAFVNAVAELRSSRRPEALLRVCREIEERRGRRRRAEPRWGPRVIDLDLLAAGDLQVAGGALDLPHPRLAERRFVLVPWAEIAPDFEIPGLGSVAALLRACGDPGTIEALAWPAAAAGGER